VRGAGDVHRGIGRQGAKVADGLECEAAKPVADALQYAHSSWCRRLACTAVLCRRAACTTDEPKEVARPRPERQHRQRLTIAIRFQPPRLAPQLDGREDVAIDLRERLFHLGRLAPAIEGELAPAEMVEIVG